MDRRAPHARLRAGAPGAAAARAGRVVGVGLCVVDHVYRVDDLALAGARTRYRERVVAPGGMAANALVQAAALGCRAELLSAVGDDAEGRALLRALRARGVATRRVARSPAAATPVALVLVDRRTGERRFVVRDRRALERGAPRFDLAPVRRGAVVVCDGHFAGRAREALAKARAVGAATVGDYTRPGRAVLGLVALTDFPIVPLEFAERFAAGDVRETLRALRARSGGTPVVTLGARGALALVGGRFRRIAPHRVRAVDTTGAGDAFHGAFAAGVARGLPVLESLAVASRAGAVACTALGATARLLGERDLPRGALGA